MNTTKNLNYYMSLNYPILLEKYEEDGQERIVLRIPELKGVWASGSNFEESMADLAETKKVWFEACLEERIKIPEPVSEEDFSGKFVLRLDRSLHRVLSEQAKQAGVSLNQYVKEILKNHLKDSEVLTQIAGLREDLKPFMGLSKEMVLVQHRVKNIEDTFSSQLEQMSQTQWLTRVLLGEQTYSNWITPQINKIGGDFYCIVPSQQPQSKEED